MKLTNKLNLPAPLVNAITNDPYNSGKSDISVTGLIGSAWQRRLARIHNDDITEDVADRIYALLGQATHSVLERAEAPNYRIEERLYHTIEPHYNYDKVGLFCPVTISGQFDLITPDGTLQDYKVTSYFACKDGPKEDWEKQLNVLRYLCWKNSIIIGNLQIVAILRDWSRTEKLRYGEKYPDVPVMVLDVPMWDLADTSEYIMDRIQEHFFMEPTPCSPEERWSKPDSWAVKKKGNKKATKVFLVKDDAEEFRQDKGENFVIEYRKGEDTRCLHYCSVAPFCEVKNV
tara:strand:- start:983 stop:1846 length:864 start_codon:yes stop_codon:yes gene_type:complete